MTSETNTSVVHRYVEDGYNTGNMSVIDELFTTDFVNHDPNQPAVRDLQELKQFFIAQRNAFADLRTTIEDLVAVGDTVVKRCTVRGTHTGVFNGIPATGKQMAMEGIDILKFVDGKICEIWWGYDMLGMLQQLGVLLRPEAASA